MAEWEDALRRLINERYGSLRAFTEQSGLPYMTIYNMLKRGISSSRTETVTAFYEALNIDWTSMGDMFANPDLSQLKLVKPANDSPDYSSKEIRVFGRIAAGTPLEMDEGDFGFSCPTQLINRYPKAFYLEVEGESMSRVLPNGCYVLVDPEQRNSVINGHVYAVCVNGYDATVKRVRKLANGIELIPDSLDPTYHSMVYDSTVEGTETVTIIGRVVWYTIPYDFEI